MDDTNKICIKQLKGSNSDPDRLDMKQITELYNRLKTEEEKDRLVTWLASVELLREYATANDLALSIDVAGGI